MATSKSQRTQEELIKMAHLYMPGGSTGNNTPPDLLINKGSGSKIWDANGNEYLDYDQVILASHADQSLKMLEDGLTI